MELQGSPIRGKDLLSAWYVVNVDFQCIQVNETFL